jgi:tetratricopeptide (TPR) repeat protein
MNRPPSREIRLQFHSPRRPLLAAILALGLGLTPETVAANVPSDVASSDSVETGNEKSAKAEQQKKIAALIAQLGDKDYFVRQKAQEELATLGFEAFEALNAATTADDLEIATRAKYLLKLMRVEWTTAADPPEVKRLLKGYEMLDPDNRQARIRELATVPDGKATAALCRLARYEKSDVLSKWAALEIIQSTANGEPPGAQRANLVRKNIDRGSRPAVLWINAWLRMARDPQGALDDFNRMIDDEMRVLKRTPEQTSSDLIAALMRYDIGQLKRLGKNDAVVATMRRLIDLQKDDAGAITALAEWFLDQKAWAPLDELENRFRPRFAAEPVLLYLYAEAKLAQNDSPKAEELAAQALKLNPGRDAAPLHYVVADNLKRRGCIQWAINELEYLITQIASQDSVGVRPVMELAEIYYDQGKNLEAGKAIEKFLKKPSGRGFFTPGAATESFGKQIKADMYYYYGLHWESQGDRKQQRDNMERAIKEDPASINALIGYYNLPDLTPAEKKKAAELIKSAADQVRESIRSFESPPDDPRENAYAAMREANDCNQFAWLIANTEGDLDESLKYARRAVELQPQNGGIADTLAHVYYAKRDYENAVKTEEKAHELEPHLEMIKRKLDVFKKALAEKK